MSEYTLIPYYSLQPDSLTIFARPEETFRTERQKNTNINLENNENKYNELSFHARKRLQKSINYMLYMTKEKEISGSKLISKNLNTEIETHKAKKRTTKIKYKITFVTLTLSAKQHNTDEEIKTHLLNYFLRFLREKKQVDLYIWKAEKQENGNIHFHILTNKYIKWQEIRTEWNKLQNKKGFEYVNLYQKNMLEFFKEGFKLFPNDERPADIQREAYEKNKLNNWTDPNSTDIHAIYKIKNVGAYMSKYMSKGVTKTTRVEELKQLYINNERNLIEIEKLDNENVFMYDDDDRKTYNQRRIDELQEQNEQNHQKIKILLAKGVSGRIWAQSQKLSKLKNFSEVENETNIPDIDIVIKNARFKHTLDLGNNKVTTYYFDIEKTPKLKAILDTHISQTYKKQLI